MGVCGVASGIVVVAAYACLMMRVMGGFEMMKQLKCSPNRGTNPDKSRVFHGSLLKKCVSIREIDTK